jgi:DNA-binding transcriptional LysR family regulator
MQPTLAGLHAAFPDVVLDVTLDDAFVDIAGEGYDIGLRLGEYVNPETVAFAFGPALRQIAVASPAYLTAHGTPRHPRDLPRHRCIDWRQHPRDAPYAWEFVRDGEEISVAVSGPLTVSDREAAVRAATKGLGIALWVEHRLREWIDRGELVPLLPDWSPPYPGFFLYYYRDRHIRTTTRAVIDFFRESAKTADGREAGERRSGISA